MSVLTSALSAAQLSVGQALAAFAVVAALLVLLFLLRRKSKRVVVASLLPWKLVVRRRVNPFWRALVALLLQLLGAGLALAALVDRSVQGPLSAELPVVFVVDTSASMAGRLEHLSERVRGSDAALLSVSQDLALIFPPGSSPARQATGLRRLQLGVGSAPLAQAVALAQSLGARPVVLTDHDPELDVDWEILGPDAGPDLSVVSVVASAGAGLPAEVQLTVTLHNHGAQDAPVVLRLETAHGVVGESALTLPPGPTVQGYAFSPVPGEWLVASLVDNQDALAANDVAYGLMPQLRPARVQIVSEAPNRYLMDGFGVMPGLDVQWVSAARYRDPGQSVDLLVFDRVAPAQSPSRPAVYFDPPADSSPFPPLGPAAEPTFTTWDFSHPLLDGVALRHIEVARLSLLKTAPGARMLAGSAQGPVVLVRDAAPRAVVFGFDLTRSDLPLTVAFPQLLYKLILWARQDAAGGAVAPAVDTDHGLHLDPGAGAVVTRLDAPGTWTTRAGSARLGGLSPGVYQVEQVGERQLVAVNLPQSEFATQAAGAPLERIVQGGVVPAERAVWVWLVLAAAVVLFAEFVVEER